MARTQKNKATSNHLGLLKAKLAKLRRELIEPKGGSGAAKPGEGIVLYLFVFIFCAFNHCLDLYIYILDCTFFIIVKDTSLLII